MKNLLLPFLFLLFVYSASGQALTGANTPSATEAPLPNTKYFSSLGNGNNDQMESRKLSGGILASCGGIITIAGFFYYNTAFDTFDGSGTVDVSKEHTGQAIMIAGGVVALAGFAIMITGNSKTPKTHSLWEVTTPKKNELGIAYNF